MKITKDLTVRSIATPFAFARMATIVFCSSNFGFVSSIIVMRCKIRFKRVQFDTAICVVLVYMSRKAKLVATRVGKRC
jgi:hypothetical protein